MHVTLYLAGLSTGNRFY